MKTFFLSITLLLIGLQGFCQSNQKVNADQPIVDNEKVRVYSYEASPGKDVCGLGKHSHPAHLTVLLTDANITITSPDGKVSSVKMKAGSSFWSEAEIHTVINSGTNEVKCQIIELKKPKF